MSQIQNNIWAAPRLSMRWWPVFLRNWLVWKKLAIPSLVGNIAEPLMWLVAFGYGLGALVGQIELGGEKVFVMSCDVSGSTIPPLTSRLRSKRAILTRLLEARRLRKDQTSWSSRSP